jgi:hypothetical protein
MAAPMPDERAARLAATAIADWDCTEEAAQTIVEAARTAGYWYIEELILNKNKVVCELLGINIDEPSQDDHDSTLDEIDSPSLNVDMPIAGITRAQANTMSWSAYKNYTLNKGWLLQHRESWINKVSITPAQPVILMGMSASQLKRLLNYHGHFFLSQCALPTKDRTREIDILPLLTAFPGLTAYLDPDTHKTVALWFSKIHPHNVPQVKSFKLMFKPTEQWLESQDVSDRTNAWAIPGHNITPAGQILSYLYNSPNHALTPPDSKEPADTDLLECRKTVASKLKELCTNHKDIGDLVALQYISDFLQDSVLIPLATLHGRVMTGEATNDASLVKDSTEAIDKLLKAAEKLQYNRLVPDLSINLSEFAKLASNYFKNPSGNDNFNEMLHLNKRVQGAKAAGSNPQLHFRDHEGKIRYKPELPKGRNLGLKEIYRNGGDLPIASETRLGHSLIYATPGIPSLPAPATPVPVTNEQQGSDRNTSRDGQAGRGGRQGGYFPGNNSQHSNSSAEFNSGGYDYSGPSTSQGFRGGRHGRWNQNHTGRGPHRFHPYNQNKGGRGGRGNGY